MTKEDKELLLKDLSARLPYNVVINCTEEDDEKTNFNCFLAPDMIKDIKSETAYWIIKPYLRPMSSITEEESKELGDLPATIEDICETLPNIPYYIEVARPEQLDWLNAHHFDFRNLIERGLAIDCIGLNVY